MLTMVHSLVVHCFDSFNSVYIWFIVALLYHAGYTTGFTVLAEGGIATERTTDILLRCDVRDLLSEEELLRITWYFYDHSYGALVEIFSADLTNDQPAFYFASRWAGRGQYELETLATIRLPSHFVTRDFTGEYRCQVNSLMSQVSTDVRVDVRYGPGTSITISPGGRVESQEGDTVMFTCSAVCNPGCSYRWYKAGRSVSGSPILSLKSLSRFDGGLYACQARNEAGRSIKPLDLRVRFPATITNLTINRLESESTSRGGLQTVQQTHDIADSSDAVVFTCQVTAWPAVTITWVRDNDNTTITADQNRTFITNTQIDLERKNSKLRLHSATCLDNGNYTCNAWNGVGKPSRKTRTLDVSCSPFETHNLKLCQNNQETRFVEKLNEIFELKLCFFGNPNPNVSVEHVTKSKEIANAYEASVTCNAAVKQCQAIFALNISSPEKYGSYRVKISNAHGFYEKNYYVMSQQPPLPPLDFAAVNTSFSSVCFTWKSMFNGGAKQTFFLQMRQVRKAARGDNTGHFNEITVDEDELSSIDGHNLSVYSVCVRDLVPSTRFEALLTSANIYGVSKPSRNVSLHTLGAPTTSMPSWLTIVPTTSSTITANVEHTSLAMPSINVTEEIEIQELHSLTTTTETPGEFSNTTSHQNRSFTDEDEEEGEESDFEEDDVNEENFFELFDIYFKSSREENGSSVTPRHAATKIRPLLNRSSPLQMFFLKYANFQQNKLGLLPLSRFSLNETANEIGVLNLTHPLWTSVSPSINKSSSSSSSEFLQTLTISATVIGIICFSGAALTLCGLVFYRKRQIQKHCKNSCQRRTKTSDTRNNITNMQTLSTGMRSIAPETCIPGLRRQFRDRAPSIRCICNDNVKFLPSAAIRPRLSTPDMNATRPKLRSSTSVPTDETETGAVSSVRRSVPTITLDNQRISCPSYLDLQSDGEVGNTPVGDYEIDDLDIFSSGSLFLQPPHRVSSYTSVNQILAKCDDVNQEETRSYLDLYEVLVSRTASRSPSNIYDPVQFDNINQAESYCGSAHTANQYQTKSTSSFCRQCCHDIGDSEKKFSSLQSKHCLHSQRKSNESGPEFISLDSIITLRSSNKVQAAPDPTNDNRISAESFYEMVDDDVKKSSEFVYANSLTNLKSVLNQPISPETYMEPCVVNCTLHNVTGHVYNRCITAANKSSPDITKESHYMEIDEFLTQEGEDEVKMSGASSQAPPALPQRNSSENKQVLPKLKHKKSHRLDDNQPDINDPGGYVKEDVIASIKKRSSHFVSPNCQAIDLKSVSGKDTEISFAHAELPGMQRAHACACQGDTGERYSNLSSFSCSDSRDSTSLK